MGIPELHAKHAVFRTGNNSADMAASWYFENMSDPTLNEPLLVAAAPAAGAGPTPEAIEGLMMMGFTEKKVRKALAACVSQLYIKLITGQQP